jgi:predicted PurR-regulated permease PerM
MTPSTTPADRAEEARFLRRVLIAAAIAALALVLWRITAPLLMIFAAVLLAVLLDAGAALFTRYLGLGRRWGLALTGLVVLGLLAAVFALVGNQVVAQMAEFTEAVRGAVRMLEQRFGLELPRLGPGENGEGTPLSTQAITGFLGQAVTIGTVIFDSFFTLVLVVVGGVYLAAQPGLYRRGLVKLFPRTRQAQVEETAGAVGEALRLWLLGQMIGMVLVGLAMGLGAWLIGLPAPLALGLIAGVLEFVPIVGPWVAAVPVVLLALTGGVEMLLWAIGLILLVQQLEGNMITPLVQRRMVHIPPAVMLFSVVIFGALFGIAGVILSGPLTVLAYVLVAKLYVQDTLRHEAEVPGVDRA